MVCLCHIVPADVLDQLSRDGGFESHHRERLANDAILTRQSTEQRRQAHERNGLAASPAAAPSPTLGSPSITVSDCRHGMTLPGAPIADPATSSDITAKNAAVAARQVFDFYSTVFGRNSIDNAGMPIESAVHFGTRYNNATWDGVRMVYGAGDGEIFTDFTQANDVICHEMTHGVIQHSLQLEYQEEPGGLNESLADVFGSMFRQWRAGQPVDAADWVIGKDIIGPVAKQRGFTCLRDMANPDAAHCVSRQPIHFSGYHDGMDPHISSGIANRAFTTAARAIGGKSWEQTGQIWYRAITSSGGQPFMTMKQFADLTRQHAQAIFPDTARIATGVDDGWKSVGL